MPFCRVSVTGCAGWRGRWRGGCCCRWWWWWWWWWCGGFATRGRGRGTHRFRRRFNPAHDRFGWRGRHLAGRGLWWTGGARARGCGRCLRIVICGECVGTGCRRYRRRRRFGRLGDRCGGNIAATGATADQREAQDEGNGDKSADAEQELHAAGERHLTHGCLLVMAEESGWGRVPTPGTASDNPPGPQRREFSGCWRRGTSRRRPPRRRRPAVLYRPHWHRTTRHC